MAGPIDGIGAASSVGEIAKGVEHIKNPGAEFAQGNSSAVSEAAQSALDGIARLQTQFDRNVLPVAEGTQQAGMVQGADPVAQGGRGEGAMSDTAMLVEQLERSSQVQAQLVQFVSASSISSSLGKNLNTFLRGQ